MGPKDLSYILLAPTQKDLLDRVSAWNRLCEDEERRLRRQG